MNRKIYIGVAWPYVNGDLHIGHLAGYLLPADIMSKYFRMSGDDTLMISGSDCHGTPTTVQADKEGVTPSQIVDLYHPKRVELMKLYGFDYSLYTKTTTENHRCVTHKMFNMLLKNGYIYKDKSLQYYSEIDKRFLPDRYVEGECPYCHSKEQRSDQCEKCGRMLNQGELIDPVSKISKSKVILKESEHYFLDLQKMADEVMKLTNINKSNYRSWVYNETVGWIKEGLKSRAITRDLDWGIVIPKDNLSSKDYIDNIDSKRIYVWFEAVIGYLSGSIEWSIRSESKDKKGEIIYQYNDNQSTDWKDWWFNKNSKHYYFMGQDNLVFHTIMWPGMLIGAEAGYKLPDNVVVNKFYNYEGKKFSKSRNWIIDSIEIADKYGVDSVRFYIAKNLPENKEGNFVWDDFFSTINNELVGKIGNFVHRTLTFAKNKFGGRVKVCDIDSEVQDRIKQAFDQSANYIEKAKLVKYFETVMKLVDFANKYFDQKAPWSSIKENSSDAEKTIFESIVLAANIATLFYPIMPGFSCKVCQYLNLNPIIYKVGRNYWKPLIITNDVSIVEELLPIFTKIKN